MIKSRIKVDKENNINYIFVSGHANYSQSGSDIVCAAVSTAIYLTIGLVEKFCPKYSFFENEDRAEMELKILETNDSTNLILINFVEALLSLENDYKKYLEVEVEYISTKK